MIVSYSISIESPVLSSNRTRNKIYFLILSEFAKFLYHSNVFVLKSKNGGESLPTLNKYFVPYCSVVQSYPALCEHMDCSMPGFLVFHCFRSLLKLIGAKSLESVMPSNHHILCCPSFCLQSFPASRSFPVSWLFASGGQSTGASVSASVLPMNIQGWFPLGFTRFCA